MKKQKITALIMAVVLASTSVVAVYAETYEVVETSEISVKTEERIRTEQLSGKRKMSRYSLFAFT